MISELEVVLARARALAADEIPRFLGELETIRAVAWSRLTAAATTTQQAHDELISIEQAAGRLGLSPSYLYRNHQKFSFTRRVGRSLRFSSQGLQSYIERTG
jgi:predicted DNA-binding transcriptional regulator AlpA